MFGGKKDDKSSKLEGTTANIGAPSLEDQINAIGLGQYQWTLFFIFALIVIADGMEMVVISLLYSALHKEWGLSKLEEGFLAAVIFTGFLFGNVVGGYLGDRWSRRNTLLASGVLFLIAGGASAFAPDLISLCLLRMLVGFAVGCKLPVSMSLLVELCPASHRGVLGLALSGFAFALGEIFVCIAGIVIHSVDHSEDWWRSLLLACIIPDIFGVPLMWRYVPESPHFLLTNGRNDEVEELVQDIAITNTGGTECLLQGGRVRAMVADEDADGERIWSLTQLFHPALRQITIFVSIIWTVCSFAYYGHVFTYPLALEQRYHMEIENQYFAVMLAGVAECPGIIIAMFLIDVEGVGRRRTVMFFFFAASVAALMCPFFVDSTSFLIANMFFKTLVNTPFCILYVFSAELFPTTHRASGIAFCSAFSRVAGACSPVISAWAISESVTLVYQIYAVALGLGAAATMVFEFETNKGSLSVFMEDSMSNATKDRSPEGRPFKHAGR